jgi:hypothetical protein
MLSSTKGGSTLNLLTKPYTQQEQGRKIRALLDVHQKQI